MLFHLVIFFVEKFDIVVQKFVDEGAKRGDLRNQRWLYKNPKKW